MKKILWIVLAVTACHVRSADNYNHKLSTWMGRPVQSLINSWGQPDHQFRINNQSVALVYIRTKKQGAYEPYHNMINYQALAGPRYGHSMYQPVYYCKTTFTVRQGVIVNYAFSGDDCI